MRERNCEACGQPLRHERLGVWLTPLKAEIFDKIKAAGAEGISTEAILASEIYRDRKHVSRKTLHAHVFQMNELLLDGDWEITSTRGRDPVWMIVKRRMGRVA